MFSLLRVGQCSFSRCHHRRTNGKQGIPSSTVIISHAKNTHVSSNGTSWFKRPCFLFFPRLFLIFTQVLRHFPTAGASHMPILCENFIRSKGNDWRDIDMGGSPERKELKPAPLPGLLWGLDGGGRSALSALSRVSTSCSSTSTPNTTTAPSSSSRHHRIFTASLTPGRQRSCWPTGDWNAGRCLSRWRQVGAGGHAATIYLLTRAQTGIRSPPPILCPPCVGGRTVVVVVGEERESRSSFSCHPNNLRILTLRHNILNESAIAATHSVAESPSSGGSGILEKDRGGISPDVGKLCGCNISMSRLRLLGVLSCRPGYRYPRHHWTGQHQANAGLAYLPTPTHRAFICDKLF